METSSTTLSGTAWEGPGTLVASISNIDLGTGGGWYEIDITDFVYSGSSNLLVSVRTQNAPYTAPHSYWRYTSTSANYRMRVGGSDSSNPPTMSLSYSRPNIQFEIVTEACSGTPDPGNTISSSSSACSGVNFTLSLQNTTPGSGVTYQWQSSLNGLDSWTNLGTASTQVTSQTAATYYRCEVTCDGNTSTSTAVQVTMNSWINCYCLPTYSSGGTGDIIAQVTLETLSQATTGNVSPYYYDYTSTQNVVPDLTQGFNSSLLLTLGTDGSQYNGVWIDFNQNGTFETTEFFTSNSNAGASGTATVVIAVPVGATLGNTRMRIRGGDDSQPTSAQACGASGSSYGQAQDYFVNVIAATSPILTVDPTSISLGSVPSGSYGYSQYVLSGINLTGFPDNIVVTAPVPGFDVSHDNSTWTGSVNVPYTSATLGNTTIYVRFAPTTSNTIYSGNITNIGGGAKASANVAVSGSSPCDAVNSFNENFDGVTAPALPACWAKLGAGGSAYTQTSNPNSSPNTLYIYSSSVSSLAAVKMQPLSNLGAGTHRFRFNMRANFSTNGVVEFGYLADPLDAATFTSLGTATASTTTYAEYIITPAAGSYSNYPAIRHTGSPTNSLMIDDVTWEQIPSCLAPTAQTVTNKTDVGADFGWTSAASTFDIFVQGAATPAPDALTTPTVEDVNGNSYTWSGGSATTPYYWWVRTDCGTGVSTWTGPNTFTTLLCNPANQCNYTFRMTDFYGDGWNGNTMAIKQGGVTIATIGSTFTTGLGPVDVSVSLCHGLAFELFWNSGGSYPEEVGVQILDAFGNSIYTKAPGIGSQNTLLYTGSTNCTPPACPAPTALTVSNISTSGAVLGWASVESFFDIYVVPAGSPAPTSGSAPTADNVGNPYTWSDGTTNTSYDWYVRADCEAGEGTGQSDWTGPNTFKTSCNSIDLPYTEGFESMTTDFNCWSVMGNTAAEGGLNGNSLVPRTGNTWFVCDPTSFTNAGAPYIHSGIRSAALGYTAPDFNWLVSTDINMPATGSVNLKFWVWYHSTTDITKFYVNVLDDGVWTTVLTYNSIANENQYTSEVVVSLDAFVGKIIKVAFVYEYNDGWQLAVDDISIKAVPLTATWTGAISTAWNNDGNWMPNAPGSITSVIIPGNLTNYPTLTAFASCNNFTIQSGGSFIGSEFLTVNGTTTIERSITGYTSGTDGWHLISSPVANQTISGNWTPAGGYDFYALDESVSEYWLNQKNHPEMTNFIPGKGYLVAYETGETKSFTGAMNSAPLTMSGLTNSGGDYAGWHLVGNPFTSAINADLLTKTDIGTNVQVWNTNSASYEISSTIPALNGFMVETTGGGELNIPLNARIHSNTSWFKSSEDEILLRANDPAGHSSQLSIIRFNPAATEAYDGAFDSHYIAGFAPMFYSKSSSESFALNTLPQLTNETVIPFDFVKNGSSDFSIEMLKAIPGALIYLTDKKTNTVTNLLENPVYSFNSVEGDITDRFLLTFASVGIDNPNVSQIEIYGYQDVIFVNGAKAGSDVVVTNLLGQVMMSTTTTGDGVNSINGRNLADGIYLVSIISGNSVVSKKVVLQK